MKNFIFTSLRLKIIVNMSVIIILFLGVFQSYQHFELKNQLEQDLKSQADVIIQRLVNELKGALWDLNEDMIQVIMSSESKNENVHAIHVKDDSNIDLKIDKDDYLLDHNLDTYLIRSQPIFHDETKIGEVKLFLTYEHIEKRLSDELISAIVLAIIEIILIILLLWIMLDKLILAPIESLVNSTKLIAEGHYSNIASKFSNDEIGLLGQSIQKMNEKISSRENEIKLSAEDLKEVKEQLELAVNGSRDGLWDWNIETNKVYFSPPWKNMIGYEDDEFLNDFESWENIIHPDDIEKTKKDIIDSHSTPEGIYENIHRLRHKNESWVWILARAKTIFNEDHKAIRMVGFHHDITESKNREKIIEQLAFYDFLTKLPNRKLFEQKVESFIKSSHFSHKKFAILFLDLDNFKWVNDSLGHRFGDEVLVKVSKRIVSTISKDSLVARIGGDEFIILSPYEEISSISKLASSIVESAHVPLIIEEKEINIGWSIGISLFPENGTSYTELLQHADTAMYEAKGKGKNNFKFFSDEMNSFVTERLKIDTKLRNAVLNKSFTLNYQPKYSYAKKKIKGLEVLIRWQDSEVGFIPPDQFIPIAEDSGYIYDIGKWVLQEALSAFKTIYSLDDTLTIAINISGKQLENHSFYNDIVYIIENSDIPPENIEFEITETAIMNNIQSVITVLHKIKAFGIQISIDDFGTGYSSMAYLKRLPLDTLKIDREFIMELEKDEESKAIVQAIIALACALKLKTIAEGVENIEQKNILEAMGCYVIQGYYYSKPLDLKTLLEFMSQ